MELLHKVGDKVRIRADLKLIYAQDPCHRFYTLYKNGNRSKCNALSNSEKIKYSNMIVTIADVIINSNREYYKIDKDNGWWCWTDEMFEDINLLDFESLI